MTLNIYQLYKINLEQKVFFSDLIKNVKSGIVFDLSESTDRVFCWKRQKWVIKGGLTTTWGVEKASTK